MQAGQHLHLDDGSRAVPVPDQQIDPVSPGGRCLSFDGDDTQGRIKAHRSESGVWICLNESGQQIAPTSLDAERNKVVDWQLHPAIVAGEAWAGRLVGA